MHGFVLAQMPIAILDLIMKAAAALPLLTALGLVFGRRGSGIFCLWGCSRLGALTLVLSFAGPVCILANYILQMTVLNAHDLFVPFFTRPAMNFSLSLLIWLLGMACLYFGTNNLKNDLAVASSRQIEEYELGSIRDAFWPLLLTSGLFFITFITSHWPFGGFPDELTHERVIMAILRNAARGYFMAFAPAGAFACVYAAWYATRIPSADSGLLQSATRWCAFWAFIGYLPHCLQNMGILLGAGARANAFDNPELGLYSQMLALALLFAGIACFAPILFRKKASANLAYAGLFLFFCAQVAPRAMLILN